jgi:hypothetical protein
MLSGEGDSFLGGTAFDGFLGMLWMPASANARGVPAKENITEALLAIGRSIYSRSTREVDLEHIIRQVLVAYQTHPSEWRESFMKLVQDPDWPQWAQAPVLHVCLTGMSIGDVPKTTERFPPAIGPALTHAAALGANAVELNTTVAQIAAQNPTVVISEAMRLPPEAWYSLRAALKATFEVDFRRQPGATHFSDVPVFFHRGNPVIVSESVARNPRALKWATQTRVNRLRPDTQMRISDIVARLNSTH